MKFSDSVYNALKWICIIALPALAVLYQGISNVFGFGYIEEALCTIEIIQTCIGSLIGLSQAEYNKTIRKD